MDNRKISDKIKNVSAVNLKYTANLIDLGKDYVKAFSTVLFDELSEPKESVERSENRPPLLLAGSAGETANAAFTVTGSPELKQPVELKLDGDFEDCKVTIVPNSITFDGNEDVVVRVVAVVGRKMKDNHSISGSVSLKDNPFKLTDFVIHKLPKSAEK